MEHSSNVEQGKVLIIVEAAAMTFENILDGELCKNS